MDGKLIGFAGAITDHRSMAVHRPIAIPAYPNLRPVELRGYDLFTEPGAIRMISTQN